LPVLALEWQNNLILARFDWHGTGHYSPTFRHGRVVDGLALALVIFRGLRVSVPVSFQKFSILLFNPSAVGDVFSFQCHHMSCSDFVVLLPRLWL
jgi:hypothetical protein